MIVHQLKSGLTVALVFPISLTLGDIDNGTLQTLVGIASMRIETYCRIHGADMNDPMFWVTTWTRYLI